MKWSLQQLHKIVDFPYHYEEEFDFTEEAKSVEDIISVRPVKITGCINHIDDETYEFKYNVKGTLVLQCALTLLPVDYPIDEDYDDIYSTVENDDYYLIEKNTVDTRQMTWLNILIDKPINFTRPDAYEILKEQGITLDEQIPDDEEIISYSDGINHEEEK